MQRRSLVCRDTQNGSAHVRVQTSTTCEPASTFDRIAVLLKLFFVVVGHGPWAVSVHAT